MSQDAAREVPPFPTDVTARSEQGQPGAGGGRRVKPFLPMMDSARYAEYKARPRPKPAYPFFGREAAVRAAAARAPAALTVLADIEGASDVDALVPPDTHGAVGRDEFVEITNSHVDIFPRTDPANRTSISQAAFFGYFTQVLFDGRAVYDSTWNRWVITAEAFPESPTVQLHFIAVSTTPQATGSFFVYALNVAFTTGDFWDFPQLGLDQDSVIVTANIFDASGNPKGADMFAVAKARLYNGLGFSVPVFTGLVGTLAPPLVLDGNSSTFLIAAQPSGSSLQLYTLRDSSRSGIVLTGPVDVAVDPYDMPPPAPQPPPCTDPANNLDTSDSRFVNASTQVGDALWQVHTIAAAGLATPRYYQVNTATQTVEQSGAFFATATSSDFNASVVANSDNDVVVTWTSTDAAAGTNAQVRFAGCDHATGPCGFLGSGSALVTSSACVTGDFDPNFGLQRWGDYSAVTVDPTNSRQAWLVNEKVNDADTWGSRIGEVSF